MLRCPFHSSHTLYSHFRDGTATRNYIAARTALRTNRHAAPVQRRCPLDMLVSEAFRSFRFYEVDAAVRVIHSLSLLDIRPPSAYAFLPFVLPTLHHYSEEQLLWLFGGLSRMGISHKILTAAILKRYVRCLSRDAATHSSGESSSMMLLDRIAMMLSLLHQFHSHDTVQAFVLALERSLSPAARRLSSPLPEKEEQSSSSSPPTSETVESLNIPLDRQARKHQVLFLVQVYDSLFPCDELADNACGTAHRATGTIKAEPPSRLLLHFFLPAALPYLSFDECAETFRVIRRLYLNHPVIESRMSAGWQAAQSLASRAIELVQVSSVVIPPTSDASSNLLRLQLAAFATVCCERALSIEYLLDAMQVDTITPETFAALVGSYTLVHSLQTSSWFDVKGGATVDAGASALPHSRFWDAALRICLERTDPTVLRAPVNLLLLTRSLLQFCEHLHLLLSAGSAPITLSELKTIRRRVASHLAQVFDLLVESLRRNPSKREVFNGTLSMCLEALDTNLSARCTVNSHGDAACFQKFAEFAETNKSRFLSGTTTSSASSLSSPRCSRGKATATSPTVRAEVEAGTTAPMPPTPSRGTVMRALQRHQSEWEVLRRLALACDTYSSDERVALCARLRDWSDTLRRRHREWLLFDRLNSRSLFFIEHAVLFLLELDPGNLRETGGTAPSTTMSCSQQSDHAVATASRCSGEWLEPLLLADAGDPQGLMPSIVSCLLCHLRKYFAQHIIPHFSTDRLEERPFYVAIRLLAALIRTGQPHLGSLNPDGQPSNNWHLFRLLVAHHPLLRQAHGAPHLLMMHVDGQEYHFLHHQLLRRGLQRKEDASVTATTTCSASPGNLPIAFSLSSSHSTSTTTQEHEESANAGMTTGLSETSVVETLSSAAATLMDCSKRYHASHTLTLIASGTTRLWRGAAERQWEKGPLPLWDAHELYRVWNRATTAQQRKPGRNVSHWDYAGWTARVEELLRLTFLFSHSMLGVAAVPYSNVPPPVFPLFSSPTVRIIETSHAYRYEHGRALCALWVYLRDLESHASGSASVAQEVVRDYRDRILRDTVTYVRWCRGVCDRSGDGIGAAVSSELVALMETLSHWSAPRLVARLFFQSTEKLSHGTTSAERKDDGADVLLVHLAQMVQLREKGVADKCDQVVAHLRMVVALNVSSCWNSTLARFRCCHHSSAQNTLPHLLSCCPETFVASDADALEEDVIWSPLRGLLDITTSGCHHLSSCSVLSNTHQKYDEMPSTQGSSSPAASDQTLFHRVACQSLVAAILYDLHSSERLHQSNEGECGAAAETTGLRRLLSAWESRTTQRCDRPSSAEEETSSSYAVALEDTLVALLRCVADERPTHFKPALSVPHVSHYDDLLRQLLSS